MDMARATFEKTCETCRRKYEYFDFARDSFLTDGRLFGTQKANKSLQFSAIFLSSLSGSGEKVWLNLVGRFAESNYNVKTQNKTDIQSFWQRISVLVLLWIYIFLQKLSDFVLVAGGAGSRRSVSAGVQITLNSLSLISFKFQISLIFSSCFFSFVVNSC